MSIAVLVPTRDRPHSILPLAGAWKHYTVDATLVIGVDEDQVDLYAPVVREAALTMEVLAPGSFIHQLNEMAARWVLRADVLGSWGDDHRPRTGRWDRQVAAALTTPGIAYGDDLLRGVDLPTAAFISSGIVRALGYFAPPQLQHYYCDNAWRDWGIHAGCLRYLPGVVIEHCHPENGKAESDAVYEAASAIFTDDQAAYAAYLEDGLVADVNKVRSCVSG